MTTRFRRIAHPMVRMALSLLIAVGGCSTGTDGSSASVAWSDDPCGLAPPQDVAAAFGASPTPIADAPAGECRYRVADVVFRLVVLSDSNTCEGATRSYAALGSELVDRAEIAPGVFVVAPEGDVLVCDAEVTYVLSAAGRSDELLDLAAKLPAQRAD